MKKFITAALILFYCTCSQAQFDAGVARKIISPDSAVFLSGYAARTAPATGILDDIWAKALAVGEKNKISLIIVTLDIIGMPHEMSEDISRAITRKYGIERSQLLINTSHTHSAPVIWPSLSSMFDLSDKDTKALIDYKVKLEENITGVIEEAVRDMKPARIFIAHTSADIAINRRQSTAKGVIIGVNKEGPVDTDVPVLKIESPEGKIRALLFGYACHNTTLDNYQVNGDYAGFAQDEIEKANPGVIAMFMEGCGADQNPDPRREVELARQHGKTLADAVQKAVSGEFRLVRPPVRTYYTTTILDFAPADRQKLTDNLINGNKFQKRRADFILKAIDKGYDVSKLSYPVQAVRFGKDFTILALAGEVVVDYSLNAKKLYPGENLFVAGYSNEVQCYIPTVRILKEGGYEPEDSMIYYLMPGPFAADVEDKIFAAINLVMKKTGAKAPKMKLTTSDTEFE